MSPCLVVLTDFFAVSNRALSYAAGLAMPLQAHLLLLHARHDELLAPDEYRSYHTWRGEQHTLYALEQLATDLPVPTEVDISEDTLSEAVHEAIQFRDPLMVVMGRPGFEGAPPDLVTRTAMGLLRHMPFPLLVVPATGWDAFPPRRLLLAVDGQPFTLNPHQSIVQRLLRATQGKLEVVHVTDDGHAQPEAEDVLSTIRQNNFVEASLTTSHLHELHHTRIVEGLLQEAARQEADLLVVVARHHSAFGSLFHRSITAQLLQECPIPLLVVPAED